MLAFVTTVLLALVSVLGGMTLMHANARAQGLAWPSDVAVLKPDPVMGEAKFWEHWVYDKSFAERFRNLDAAKASSEMAPGVRAIIFRTYKEHIFDRNPDMFRCEYEVYFDSRVRIPLGDRDAPNAPRPSGVSLAYQRLEPLREEDRNAIARAARARKEPKSPPLILADGNIENRFATFSLGPYFPELLPGLSMATLGRGDFRCTVLAPKRSGARYWLSLFGELSRNAKGSPQPHRYTDEFRKWLYYGTFDPGSVEGALDKGYVLLPESFYETVLPKVTLIKSMNQCIAERSAYARGSSKDISGAKDRILAACEAVEQKGEIYHIGLDGLLRGWHGIGF